MENQSVFGSTFSQWKERGTEGKASATHYLNVSTKEKFLVTLRTTNEGTKLTNSISCEQSCYSGLSLIQLPLIRTSP